MSELRYLLSRRLKDVGQAVKVRERAQAREAFDNYYNAITDECIRQMEWARRETTFITSLDYDNDVIDFHELTLAPDGWKPE